VSNLEFISEFSKRATEVFNDAERAHAAVDEFELLDPREASIIYRAFGQDSDSVEFTHTKARISALVASGAISSDLAALATLEAPKNPTVPDNEEDYMYSRMALDGALALDSNRLIDTTGKISRMISRGDSKQKIQEAFNKSTLFNSRMDVLNEMGSETSLDMVVTIAEFQELLDALENLLDPAEPVDLIELAKSAVSKYDDNGTVQDMISGGSKSKEIFEALNNSDGWREDFVDFTTRDDVQTPSLSQSASWNTFISVVAAIKDLDDL
jgi:hypothetical protein